MYSMICNREPDGYVQEILSQIDEKSVKDAIDLLKAQVATAVASNDAEHQTLHQTQGEKSSLTLYTSKRKRGDYPIVCSTPENRGRSSSDGSLGPQSGVPPSTGRSDAPFEERFFDMFERGQDGNVIPAELFNWSFCNDMSMADFLLHISCTHLFPSAVMDLPPPVLTELFNVTQNIIMFKNEMKEFELTVLDSSRLFTLMKKFSNK